MRLQKQVLYALDAVAMITETQARKFDAVILTQDIADELGISKEFTRNILSILVRANVLVSVRGPSGGYRLAREPEKITVLSIIEALMPQEVDSLNENLLNTRSLLSQELCETLQHQTRKLFENSLSHFAKPRNMGIIKTPSKK